LIEKTLKYKVAVRPYTVNDAKIMKRLIDAKCSAIITDYPEMAFQLRGEILK